jgi:hypothetical protein
MKPNDNNYQSSVLSHATSIDNHQAEVIREYKSSTTPKKDNRKALHDSGLIVSKPKIKISLPYKDED